ncbi:LysR substrate-binding domain-containing protein [Celeribacter neptunius]|uniref:Transcriptional regulator, LysR family n=1 Tax=Celeribacter neptunius TaxID=588602 RepID=A0A1I3JWV1_9RHOB|nr:LysR substrate-binding domain-containing protein [Celeribacter neptunius]SFI64654.1 transcriptional regulator, LysR family [Celeribacter neptunius]
MAIPIRDLHTFHVVARCGSMVAAARELGVTPGAISQRIKTIEDRYGARLFTRSRKGIALTKVGASFWSEIREAFGAIEAAHAAQLAGPATPLIRINAAPTYAWSSLVSDLGAFQAVHPKIRLTVETEDRLVDLRSEPVDLAIRHGLGTYPGLKSVWLCAPELIVVASPDLLAEKGPIRSAADCLNFTLLPDSTGKDWPLWLRAQGVDETRARYGTAFKDDFLTVKAATKGQGVALLNDVYVRDELAAGRLVRALDASWPTKFAYYAVGLPETFQRPPVAALVTWLQAASGPERG